MKIEIKCKNCPYYTGLQCHGHGDYWGECTLYQDKAKLLQKLFETKDTYFHEKDVWALIRYDEDTCKFFELVKYDKK